MAERSIFIVGNCQVRPLADALRMLFPGDLVIEIASWDFDEEYTAKATAYLRSLDVQIRMPLVDSPLSQEMIGEAPGQQLVEIPSFTFSAFHPDMVYALAADGDLFRGEADYHSAIGLWAWKQGASAEQASQLFRDDLLVALGYDEYWDVSVDAARETFEASDLDFAPFWANVHRSGVFMHTINHPNLLGVAAFAKSIAARIGASTDVWDYPLTRYLTDYCPSAVWPVFPLVGRRLGVPGAWHWRLQERQYLSVAEYLEAAYGAYAGVDPSSVTCHRLGDGRYDEVLAPALAEIRGRH
ncbi:MAG TPA: WcbI family polysaccharide biosynthesis putative acetyltransferase [Acidimicrobiales bacterium]|nr:WcbI family polysaccharide biosynthesis putative acetyltransferase [Acidimicrobiales bacterium]